MRDRGVREEREREREKERKRERDRERERDMFGWMGSWYFVYDLRIIGLTSSIF